MVVLTCAMKAKEANAAPADPPSTKHPKSETSSESERILASKMALSMMYRVQEGTRNNSIAATRSATATCDRMPDQATRWLPVAAANSLMPPSPRAAAVPISEIYSE